MTKTYSMIFANNVRKYARCKHLRLGVIEKEAGISAGYLSRVSKYSGLLLLDTACRLAEIVGLDIWKLLDDGFTASIRNKEILKEIKAKEIEIKKKEAEIEELRRRLMVQDIESLKGDGKNLEEKDG